MKYINSKKAYHCPAKILAILMNIVVFLADFPSDLVDWFLKIIELVAIINLLIISRKWHINKGVALALFRNPNQVNKQPLG